MGLMDNGIGDGMAVPPIAFAAPAPNPARALVRALKEGDTAKVAELIDGDRENVLLERRGMWENTPLLVACHYGHAATALMLLERGACASAVNEAGCTALLFACNEGLAQLVERLLADPSVAVDPPPAGWLVPWDGEEIPGLLSAMRLRPRANTLPKTPAERRAALQHGRRQVVVVVLRSPAHKVRQGLVDDLSLIHI